MPFQKARALLTIRRPARPAWRNPARIAATATITAALLAAGTDAASAAEAHFVPEATTIGWDGVVATVSFREVDVAVRGTTTISTKLSAEVKAFCTNGESSLDLRASATGLVTTEYPISDGVVAGIAKFPVQVRIQHDPGYQCVIRDRSITASLKDLRTGATLVHHQS
ncbi:hypothetical protein [Amycolatopsis sp. WGS_07]|uniref:hypothetical protein n=1 Tax=Amycolatopsis sp. WGS_07 TaxID=3076764 RepID=UPI0038730F30